MSLAGWWSRYLELPAEFPEIPYRLRRITARNINLTVQLNSILMFAISQIRVNEFTTPCWTNEYFYRILPSNRNLRNRATPIVDTELLKTFLELNRTRHFGRAAENLHITQAAVSARIKQLESSVGTNLFFRDRNNLQLSPAGERLIDHADSILTAWTKAIQDVALVDEAKNYLSVGSTSGLWHFFLTSKLSEVKSTLPGTVLRADLDSDLVLYKSIQDGIIDVAILYEPSKSASLAAKSLGKVKLVLVSAKKNNSLENVYNGGYVFVDWGARFKVFHAKKYKQQER